MALAGWVVTYMKGKPHGLRNDNVCEFDKPFSRGHQSQPCGKCDYTSPWEVQLGDIFAMRKPVLSLKPMSSANTPATLTHMSWLKQTEKKKKVYFLFYLPIVQAEREPDANDSVMCNMDDSVCCSLVAVKRYIKCVKHQHSLVTVCVLIWARLLIGCQQISFSLILNKLTVMVCGFCCI